jgi:hypothetical protein
MKKNLRWLCATVALIASMAVPATAEASKTEGLTVTPEVLSLKAAWTGYVGTPPPGKGWRIKWRPVGVTKWAKADDPEEGLRSYTIKPLEVKEYEVTVAPLYEVEGKIKAGIAQNATGTPLAEEAKTYAPPVGYQFDAATWATEFLTSLDTAWMEQHSTGPARLYGNSTSYTYPGLFKTTLWTGYRDWWLGDSSDESGASRYKIAAEEPTGSEERTRFLKKVEEDHSHGTNTAWFDDVQFAGGHRPPEPELAKWNEAQTLVIEATRAKYPTGYITTNTHYFEIIPVITQGGKNLKTMAEKNEESGEPLYERTLKALSGHGSVFEEWGTGGASTTTPGGEAHSLSGLATSQSKYRQWLEYVEYLHVRGVSVTEGWQYPWHTANPEEPYKVKEGKEEGSAQTSYVAEFALATLDLVTNGTDSIDGGHLHGPSSTTPEYWRQMYGMKLGKPTAARAPRTESGLNKRTFEHGVVYTVEPGGTEQTVSLGGTYTNRNGEAVTSVTLKPAQGAVLEA